MLFSGRHTDSVGNEIYPGEYVAYNRSGEVHLGRVINIGPVEQDASWKYRGAQTSCSISVKNQNDQKVSHVRNTKSLRVIGF